MAAPPTDARSLLKSANEHAHWLIQLADTKANVLMAASALLAGLIVQQAIPACSGDARYAVFLAVGLALSSAGACLAALFPRTRSAGPPSLLYFDAIDRFRDGAEYFSKVQSFTAADTDRELAQQTWELSRIQERKYYWLRWGFRFFGLCLVATLLSVVWTHLPCG